MSQTTYSVIRVRYPASLSESEKVRVFGSLTRFCVLHSGRILSNLENTFFLTDLEGRYVSQILRICEVGGAISTVRLLSCMFFDKLFQGEDK